MSTALIKSTPVLEQLAIIGRSLPPAEENILRAGQGDKVRKVEPEDLKQGIGNIMRWISVDLGIRKSGDSTDQAYMEARFIQIVSMYYRDLTLSEVKVAFELLIVGELDEYLPKNNDGTARREHYQYFNADFISRILSAYRKRRAALTAKLEILLPERSHEKSPEEIRKINVDYREFLKGILERIAASEPVRDYEYSSYIYSLIIAANDLPDDPPTQEEYEAAKKSILSNYSISLWVRTEVETFWEEGKIAPRIVQLARTASQTRLIKFYLTGNPERVAKTLEYYDNRNNSGH